jgi:glucosylceramidase
MNQKKTVRWVATTRYPEEKWLGCPVSPKVGRANLALTGSKHQAIQGFGGCFNELGWIALRSLTPAERAKVLRELFHPTEGCRFSLCRLPIGASDYAADWYSHNETPGDFAMREFSIARDREHLLSYIKSALKFRKDLKLFASPWSPPTWMKRPEVYNYGTFIMERRYLDAYALYFRRFVEAYRKEGVTVHQIHPQNEPLADQKFPSCLWTGRDMARFIGQHLGPALERASPDCEIWLGTLNTDDFNGWPRTVLSDPEAARYVRGVGLQWAGKGQAKLIHETFPGLPLMQTENECGDGQNTWEYAEYVFRLIRHYLGNGVGAYVYWNMVLEEEGRSTWGWKQNSMITVLPEWKMALFNPELYVMKHFSHFVDPGAVRLGLCGEWTGNALAFENPDGAVVLVVHNPFDKAQTLGFDGRFRAKLAPRSFNTFVV